MTNLNALRSRLASLFQKPMVRGTLWILIAQGLRIVLQALYFVIIARALGVEQYGEFVGATALVAILSPFAGLGSDTLLLKNVARNRALFRDYWGNALFMISVTGLGLMVLLILLAPIFLPRTISPLLLLLVALSDLFFTSIVFVSTQSFQAVDRLSLTAQISTFAMLTKVLAAIALMHFYTQASTIDWAYLYLASSAVSALLAILVVNRLLGTPKLALSRIKPELADGFFFAIGASSYTIYNDIDKTMLARLSTLEATGIYAAAYRLIDVAFVPVRSITAAAYAHFFREGKNGISSALTLAKQLVKIAGSYGLIAGIGLLLFAPVVPYVLGNEYAIAVEALRWLAPIPFFRAVQCFGADALSGAGYQGLRSAVQVIIALFNILLNLWLIPLYSWKGAAWSSLASDGLLMLLIWALLAFMHRQHSSNSQGG
ncbi:MAG: flippase [Mojavia pulchra JT2-VF2]|jgi:O-antigen/teichoic acid export membrane protein|uniref:Flippase n=1 Tax=Mojavia pulchra JT2-VF2 TaxID=287848 RepID=A0A951UIP5_9NOST|nr:flippase [Mojavia pulchra JT2-VF2]